MLIIILPVKGLKLEKVFDPPGSDVSTTLQSACWLNTPVDPHLAMKFGEPPPLQYQRRSLKR